MDYLLSREKPTDASGFRCRQRSVQFVVSDISTANILRIDVSTDVDAHN